MVANVYLSAKLGINTKQDISNVMKGLGKHKLTQVKRKRKRNLASILVAMVEILSSIQKLIINAASNQILIINVELGCGS